MSTDHVINLNDISADDTAIVGGKSANLGELARIDVPVLPGFTTTSAAYEHYIAETGIKDDIRDALGGLDTDDVSNLRDHGKKVRELILATEMPEGLREEILAEYERMGDRIGTENPAVAVRSSATAEDLPGASFAGQQETYLNVSGPDDLIEAVKKCYASLFTDRAISYRVDKGFSHFDVQLSCVVQKMGRSDIGASGVMFTMDPDSGFDGVVTIEAAYGYGEMVVQGEVNPDDYIVFKETDGILEKRLGSKQRKMIGTDDGTEIVETSDDEQNSFVLDDSAILELAGYAEAIEDHYSQPMDIEWVLDGDLDELFVVQARPETVHAVEDKHVIRTYKMQETGDVVLSGAAIGDRIGAGSVKVLDSPDQMDQFSEGDVLVTTMTDPDWEPIMKKAGAIVTDKGGKTSHAAIVSRELGVPAIVGSGTATQDLTDGQDVTVDCTGSDGNVYDGLLDFEIDEQQLDDIPETETDVMLILGNPSRAFSYADLPVKGVGLAREEFIISSHVGAHPLYLIEEGRGDEYREALRSGIAKIGAAFYPNDVIVRLSDFKSDEYAGLEGGADHEPDEANPMLGWRGASRYYDDEFKDAFKLECEAIREVRDEVGLDNVIVMVPFCRTPEEGEKVLDAMEEYGLKQGENGLDVYVMAEVPSNIVLADAYAEIFDGFSIGSNDLTQLTLGVDRNSEKLAYLFSEDEPAVRMSISSLIDTADRTHTKVGICGDAPSTVEGYAEFLVDEGIDSISVSPDVALETIVKVAKAEQQAGKTKNTTRKDSGSGGKTSFFGRLLGN